MLFSWLLSFVQTIGDMDAFRTLVSYRAFHAIRSWVFCAIGNMMSDGLGAKLILLVFFALGEAVTTRPMREGDFPGDLPFLAP